jgi:hypothetical protein
MTSTPVGWSRAVTQPQFVFCSQLPILTRVRSLHGPSTPNCGALKRPIQTAKLVASIDQVSQGRFLFGVGGG